VRKLKCIGVLVLLLVLLIPTTVFPSSGDGDIPEHRASGIVGSEGPCPIPEFDFDWGRVWNWIVEALTVLPL
jgi:hypothetical protein